MSASHSPGPWRAIYHAPDRVFFVKSVDDTNLCEIPGVRDFDELNARLIAAAPELLVAVKNLVRYLDETDVDGMTCHAEEMIAAHNAIAKAEGKEGN